MDVFKLIDSKIVDIAEVVVCLFDHCNLKCVFCHQDHDNTTGASREEVLSKVPGIVDWINSNQRSTVFKINIMGGELFQDRWVDAGFLEIYQQFIDDIHRLTKPGLTIIPNFVTNLVFLPSTADKVLNFINRNALKIAPSYDPCGRFNATDLETFKTNVEKFEAVIGSVGIVITRQNIAAVIKGDPYFDYLYERFVIYWDTLLPALPDVSEQLMPKESEMLALYKLLVDRYPKCANISYFTETSETGVNKMSCTRGNCHTVFYDNSVPKGCSGAATIRDNATAEVWAPIVVQKFFDMYNCFQCEYFSKCPFTCFIKNDYKKIDRDVGECVFKLTYQYVESKK